MPVECLHTGGVKAQSFRGTTSSSIKGVKVEKEEENVALPSEGNVKKGLVAALLRHIS